MSLTRSVSPACAERAANPMTRAIAVVPALRDRPARTLGGRGKSRDIEGSAQDLKGGFLRPPTLSTGRQWRLVSRWGLGIILCYGSSGRIVPASGTSWASGTDD